MNIQDWPRLNTLEERMLMNEKSEMQKRLRRFQRWIFLPVLGIAAALSILSIFSGFPGLIWLYVGTIFGLLASVGWMDFPGRPIALFLMRLNLKKKQVLRHVRWRVRKTFLGFLKRVFNYRRFRDTPDEHGGFRNETLIT